MWFDCFTSFVHRYYRRNGGKQQRSWMAIYSLMNGRRSMKILSTTGNLSERLDVRCEISVKSRMPEGALECLRPAYGRTSRRLNLLGRFLSGTRYDLTDSVFFTYRLYSEVRTALLVSMEGD